MRHYAIKRNDGFIAIMQVVDGADVEECVRKFKEVQPNYTTHHPIDKADLPKDRSKRHAWTLDPQGKVIIDPAKASQGNPT